MSRTDHHGTRDARVKDGFFLPRRILACLTTRKAIVENVESFAPAARATAFAGLKRITSDNAYCWQQLEDERIANLANYALRECGLAEWECELLVHDHDAPTKVAKHIEFHAPKRQSIRHYPKQVGFQARPSANRYATFDVETPSLVQMATRRARNLGITK